MHCYFHVQVNVHAVAMCIEQRPVSSACADTCHLDQLHSHIACLCAPATWKQNSVWLVGVQNCGVNLDPALLAATARPKIPDSIPASTASSPNSSPFWYRDSWRRPNSTEECRRTKRNHVHTVFSFLSYKHRIWHYPPKTTFLPAKLALSYPASRRALAPKSEKVPQESSD